MRTPVRLTGRLRQTLLLASSQTVSAVLALLTLWASLELMAETSRWSLLLLMVLLAIRFGYRYIRGPKPVLDGHRLRLRSRQILLDETGIAVVLLAACYILQWPIDPRAVVAFVVANYIVQLGHMTFSQLVVEV
ncbi:MAG: hypothetical protein KKA42_00990, partial [candidate division Zixibacteria bacterium]|nr:hypothetical protein [candidate division Zixibacteria bacterium]